MPQLIPSYRRKYMELQVALVNVGLIALLAFVVEILVEHLVGKPLEQAAPHTPRWYWALHWGGSRRSTCSRA